MKSGKKKNARPIFSAKKLGKRKRLARKIATDPALRDRFLDACAATLATDRAAYFDSLLSAWEQATAGLNEAFNSLQADPAAKPDADQIALFSKPWDPVLVKLFLRLAGHLAETEARVFRLRVDRLITAWNSFAAVLAMRRPAMRAAIDRLRDTTNLLAGHVAGIFLGEKAPKLGEEYKKLFSAYHNILDTLREQGVLA